MTRFNLLKLKSKSKRRHDSPSKKANTIKARPQVDSLDERVVPTTGVFTGVTPPAALIGAQPTTATPAQTAYQAFLQRRQDLFAARQTAMGRASAQPRVLPQPTRTPTMSPLSGFPGRSTSTIPSSPAFPRSSLAFGDPTNTPGNRFAYSSPSILNNTGIGNRIRYFSGPSILGNTGIGNRFRYFSGATVPGATSLRPSVPTTSTFRAPTAVASPLFSLVQARRAALNPAPAPTQIPPQLTGANPDVTDSEVKNGPLAKAGPQLASLYGSFSQTGQVDPAFASIMRIQGDTVGVSVRGLGDPSALAGSLADQGLVASGSTTAGQIAYVEGFIPISRLPELAARADVVGIDPSLIEITY